MCYNTQKEPCKLLTPKCVFQGRFGLGFNAVYHFTDVPSFVSGDHVVMFDPHARYLPGMFLLSWIGSGGFAPFTLLLVEKR